jgi:peptidoglycan/xylan/chitin deacetylase (PgdA/CDA1 family)
MRKNKRILLLAGIAFAVTIALFAILRSQTEYVVPVLMYHSIDNDDKTSKLSVSPENFARQMEFLHKNRYNVISLEKAIPYIMKRENPPAKTIAITFDDGFENNYKSAYPVLKKYNIPATIFVVTSYVGSPGFLSWSEIKEMSDSGIISIGSHTMTHFWLLESAPGFLKDEVDGSKEILEKKIGKRVSLFCYPMGSFDGQSKKAVKDAGYSCAVSTSPCGVSLDDIFAVKRVKISRSSDNLFIFWGETTRLYTWFKSRRRYK